MTTIPYTLEQARELAYANRPELKSFEAQRKAQDQNIAVARRGHLPDLTFDTVYGRRHVSNETANGKNLNTFPLQPAWSVNLNLNIPIFDGFRTTNRVEETLRNYLRYQSPGRGAAAAGHSRCGIDVSPARGAARTH